MTDELERWTEDLFRIFNSVSGCEYEEEDILGMARHAANYMQIKHQALVDEVRLLRQQVVPLPSEHYNEKIITLEKEIIALKADLWAVVLVLKEHACIDKPEQGIYRDSCTCYKVRQRPGVVKAMEEKP